MPDSCTILRESAGAPEDVAPLLAVGSLPLAVVLDQRTMLLFGWLASAPPETASISFGGGALHGGWQATTWRAAKADDVDAFHFVAVLRTENIVRAQTMPMVLISPDSSRPAELPTIGRIELDAAPLLEPLRDAAADLATIFDFVKSVLVPQPPQQPPSPRVRDFLLGFLSAISVHDGFVEILGRPDCGGLLLQGWSVHLEAGTLDFASCVLGSIFTRPLSRRSSGPTCFRRREASSLSRRRRAKSIRIP
jgi:hypothetical protein